MPAVPQPITTPERLWVSEKVATEMIAECRRAAPAETGGVLLGYWGFPAPEPVVTHWVGPGPQAIHDRDRFVPNQRYQLDEIAKLYHASGRTLHYLGDWHSHPGGGGELSALDRRTLRRIALCRTARAVHPVMLVLAGDAAWEPAAWIEERVWHYVCFPNWCVRRLAVKVFVASNDTLK